MLQMMIATLREGAEAFFDLRLARPMPSRSLERNKSSARYVGGVLVVLLHVVVVSALLQIASVRSRAAEACTGARRN